MEAAQLTKVSTSFLWPAIRWRDTRWKYQPVTALYQLFIYVIYLYSVVFPCQQICFPLIYTYCIIPGSVSLAHSKCTKTVYRLVVFMQDIASVTLEETRGAEPLTLHHRPTVTDPFNLLKNVHPWFFSAAKSSFCLSTSVLTDTQSVRCGQ